MKKIIIILISVIFSVSFYNSKVIARAIDIVSREELPNEIKSIKLENNRLIITGWALLNAKQHFLNNTTHSYQILVKSNKNSMTYEGEIKAVSQTEMMKYTGSRRCKDNEFNKISNICNYDYENVGFEFSIPLNIFQANETYYFDLVVKGHLINEIYKTPVYFPMNNEITYEKSPLIYRAISRLEDSKLIITHSDVIVRNQPSKNGLHYQGSLSCSSSYGKSLFFKQYTIFENIYEKKVVGDNTYYRVMGKEDKCISGRLNLIEGTQFNPVWIVSNFVAYAGEPLKLVVNVNTNYLTYRFIDGFTIDNDTKLPAIWTKKELKQLYNDESIIYNYILN